MSQYPLPLLAYGTTVIQMATEATAATTPLLTLPNDLLFQPLDSVAVEEPEFPWEYSYNDRYPHKPQQYATEFDRKYPRDRFGDETDENAKVWKIYYDRARERDEDLIESWKETLDVLLVFAGLFSAVCAGFIVEAQGRLQPDWDEINARSAYALWASAQEGSVLRTVPPNPDEFSASIDVLFTNSLWFLSLTISLLASLLAILAKQWISQYRSRMRAHVATHKRWVWRHHISNRGLAHWKLDMIISSLPVMLHIALFLFLVGLVTFLLPLERHLAYLLASLSLFSFAGYLVTTIILPLIYDDCPMSTPLLWAFIFAYHTTRRRFGWWIQLHGWRKSTSARPSPPEAIDTTVLQDQRLFRSSDPAKRDVESLLWMVHHLPADEEVEAALDAIGTLSIADHRPYFTEAVRRDLHRRVTLRANTLVTSMNQDFNEAAHVSAIRTHLFLGELDGGPTGFLMRD
ncbi:hypothetical protein BKA62DRAFT_797553 [Auriculariales sp. MPI-PUGE-AT-0066]|nr:hypothetical protein BKA62DRAFT_797553 [Auriculariales sp. MPI-PUGE-AT-0066]